ncbi:hypothetical protein CPC735_017160 [Coccidioides posadasii C735 delta SOWgp]|uniref:Uncharacterized protein n=1 Tax=Coccidioides posadasii (strain C735) TaxID=222929 RepID=C5PDF3_COCP7|nr:hypothetical protein CPC735_017160 [Coccidioides posadasii C735 delta SOWgp]EER25114.1 hypothetical protein CPC735_017160 [Coccidioides posadasii C735 delta SOWgp]|eukprot:XP_003067259.1 hypothetical protein CPC735_017160 [Coccidioides posadasii C735 delta SOWgp]
MGPKKKLSREKERRLVDQHNIKFDGPIQPSEWPTSYAQIFRKVRDIEKVRSDEYCSSQRNDLLEAQRNRNFNRASNLVNAAYECRISSLDEENWRRKTEDFLLKRFSSDSKCELCRKYRWISEFRVAAPSFVALETFPDSARKICLCSYNQTGVVNRETLRKPFVWRTNAPVVHDAISEIGTRQPDIIVGLSETPELKNASEEYQGLVFSPIKGEGCGVFHFLILEAKSESGGPGFSSVEIQTAFPIKTVLNVQKALNEATGNTILPLVWFLAYQGDEWRVYACYLDGDKTRVIDLWHGTILRHDCALQLLLIIDFIWDWARNVYRREIFRCLGIGNRVNQFTGSSIENDIFFDSDILDEGSDSETESTMNADDLSATASGVFDMSISPVDECDDARIESTISTPDIINLSTPARDDIDLITANPDGTQHPASHALDVAPHADMCLGRHEESNAGPVIRNANQVFFSFRHLMLPESRDSLIEILAAIKPGVSIIDNARYLLTFLDTESAVVVTRLFVTDLEELWTETRSGRSELLDGAVVAHISFRTYFRPTDWHLVRQLSCITASCEAINALASIVWDGFSSLCRELGRAPKPTLDIARDLRLLFGADSAGAAAVNLCLSLQFAEGHYRWIKETRQSSNALWVALEEHIPGIPLSSISFHSSTVSIVVHDSCAIDTLDQFERFGMATRSDGAIILKRPIAWLQSCPKYCLVVFDNSDIEDPDNVRHKLLQVLSNKGLYLENGYRKEEADQEALELWLENYIS